MCVWQSISPGRIVAPLRSITSAPAGIVSPVPTCVTLSSCTMIIAFEITPPDFGSTRRAALTTVIFGAVGFAGAVDWAASDDAARRIENAVLKNFMASPCLRLVIRCRRSAEVGVLSVGRARLARTTSCRRYKLPGREDGGQPVRA